MCAVKRTKRRLRSGLVALSMLGGLVACKTAAPPPPVPVVPVAEVEPAPPQEYVRVTGSRLNVREQPTTNAPTVARVKKGERLEVLGREGEWVRVRLADGATGWVHGKYVHSDEPCTPDKATADLLSGVPLSFTEGQSVGTVVLEATVDATGTVVSTKVVRDTTGIPELVQRAESEARTLRFSPPVRNCRPVPFVYTYTRNF
jgi:outer membrane biosynthesis protein TonB